MSNNEIEKKIHSLFASTASSMGYSEINGMIISVLFVSKKPLSLQEISKKTGYSISSISIALDLLEIIGIVKKIKNTGDRKLYAKLDGNILEGLRTAFLLKIEAAIEDTLEGLNKMRKDVNNKSTKQMLKTVEKEVKKLEIYINKLKEVDVAGD